MRSKRVDANQPEIVEQLRAAGMSVEPTHAVGAGFPDLVVGVTLSCGCRFTFLVEVKMPRGQLNARQQRWHKQWTGQVLVITEAQQMIDYIRRLGEAHSEAPGCTAHTPDGRA